MKKGFMAVVMILAATSLLVAGCASDEAPPANGNNGGGEPREVIEWKMQDWAAEADPTYQAAEHFTEQVAEMSDGELVIKPYASGGLVSGGQEYEGLITGTVECIHTAQGWAQDLAPGCSVFSQLPGGPTASQVLMWYMEGEGTELAEEFFMDTVGVRFISNLTFHPAEVWAHTNKRIDSVDDLEGLKIRCGGESGEVLDRLGASIVFMPGGEIYESAQRGVIDAFEYVTPHVNWDMGFQEVTDYMYLSPSRAPWDAQAFFVDPDEWEALPSRLKAIVISAARDEAATFYSNSVRKDYEALQKFKDYGTEVQQLPAAVDAAVAEEARDFYDEKAEEDSPWYGTLTESLYEWKEMCDSLGM